MIDEEMATNGRGGKNRFLGERRVGNNTDIIADLDPGRQELAAEFGFGYRKLFGNIGLKPIHIFKSDDLAHGKVTADL